MKLDRSCWLSRSPMCIITRAWFQQPKLSPIPVSLLDHVEAARVNVSSFTYFNRANGFHSQMKRLSFDDQIMLLIVKTSRKSMI